MVFNVLGLKSAVLLCLLSTVPAWAKPSAQADFIANTFPSAEPRMASLWLTGELKESLRQKFDFSANKVRLRYWHLGERSAWVLEEVGKEQPITMGIVVERNHIEEIEVLVYRESRGDEIQYPFFRKQFYGSILNQKKRRYELSEQIDGITGATLSVRAMKKVAKVALFLHRAALTPSTNDQDKNL